MYFAGIDSGSRTVKVAIMDEERLLTYHVDDMGISSHDSSRACLKQALSQIGLTVDDLNFVASTGYGRELAPFAQVAYTDIACHAKGVNWFFPQARTILDLGGQDYKAISIDGRGRVTKFLMNDKCAGGTGRFLEVMADVLETTTAEIGEQALQSRKKVVLSSTCAIFAQSEVLSLVRGGEALADICAALCTLVAMQAYKLLYQLDIQPDFAMTGGGAKNAGVVAKMKDLVGYEPLLPPDPQAVGAVGAAVLAKERYLARARQQQTAV